ncbi:sodium:solute symporter [Citrobacter braakii]
MNNVKSELKSFLCLLLYVSFISTLSGIGLAAGVFCFLGMARIIP